jgi:hypothetical protein
MSNASKAATITNVAAILGGLVWAGLTVWHGFIIYRVGLPDVAIGWLIMGLPAGALFLQLTLFWWLRIGRTHVGFVLASLSLLFGAGLAALEAINHFSGYE